MRRFLGILAFVLVFFTMPPVRAQQAPPADGKLACKPISIAGQQVIVVEAGDLSYTFGYAAKGHGKPSQDQFCFPSPDLKYHIIYQRLDDKKVLRAERDGIGIDRNFKKLKMDELDETIRTSMNMMREAAQVCYAQQPPIKNTK